jgi:RNA polymerase sigma factor (sigma-70 family)
MPPQLIRLAADRGRYEQLVVARFGGTLSREDAEDIVSEALLAVAGKVPPDAGPAWFTRVVLNRAEDFRRARDGRRTARRFVALDETLPAEPERDEGFERELAHRTVHRALKRLPDDHVTLLRRRHLAGGSRREVASALGLSVHQYEKRHAQAWGALVRVVAADEPTPRCRPVRRSGHHAESHLVECLNCRLALSV